MVFGAASALLPEPASSPDVAGTSTGVTAHGVQSGCEDFTPAGGAPGWVAGCETSEVNGRGIYSHIYRVRTEMNVHMCTTAAPCP